MFPQTKKEEKVEAAGGQENDFRMCAINNKRSPSLPAPHEECMILSAE